ncbi:PREDICTED: extracellular matrix-binding protein ebh-like [Cyphomyrmex costatus]|uniref:extracellular matrix-binding protein ebh-like n=1 Tax=Cyphomyrmex costatus TaxID=456900 RepID=UPI0008524478|nr:PREDICTED: extracellular matrix-binding protein ebh-like [Cyphomyrmex costatus]
MASREKKPLAPSKSKQKASNDSVLPSNEVKNKKGKSLLNVKQQLAAQEIFDTVATGSQLPVKLEASLPRRNALKNLKRKQNLRATKTNLIKSKVTKKVTNKDIHRIAPDVKKGAKGAKKVRQPEDSTAKTADTAPKFSENQTNNGDNEGKGTETPSKSAKSNLRTKKTKSDVQNKEEASATSSTKVSPKLGKKGKTTESPDSLTKSAKTVKLTNLKKNSTSLVKVAETDNKSGKNRKNTGKELDCGASARSSVEKFPKTILDNKNSIDLTIDEVIASMLSDSENQQSVTEKTEGKVKRNKKMLVDENIACDIEIKKEPDTDDTKGTSDGESVEADQGLQNAIQLRKRSKVGYIEQPSQRSLRNGKQRQLSDLGNSTDNDPKKRHRLNSDGTVISDNLIEHASDCNINNDSCFSDPGCNESQNTAASSKEEICSKDEAFNFEEDVETGSEIENNNNSDRTDRTGETGPTLRSKTKAKTTECEATKDDDIKIEDVRIMPRCTETQEDSKKLNNFEQVKRDNILAKFTDKSRGRRSSLNIDMKKTVNSFYSTDKSDGNSKSQIDQMIEDIKLNIAKSIENKIFGPEKGLGLSKNFDVPKIEEIVAPLSTESQKMGLEDNTDEDKSTVTKNEITSENSENSVPKVADTAKEIEEKLVKFDIGEAETHSQNVQENKSSDNDGINDVRSNCESTCNINNSNTAEQSYKNVDEPEKENVSCSTTSGANVSNTESKILDENKKITRKSSRINDKNFTDNVSNNEMRKSNRTPNKPISRSNSMEDIVADIQKSINEETISEDQILDDNIVALTVSPSISSEQTEKIFMEEHLQVKGTEELESEISLNVTDNSEEAETLESISREVERLVAEDHSAKPLPNVTNDTMRNEDTMCDTKILDKEQEIQNNQETSVCRNESSTPLESAVNNTNETPSKSLDGKSTDTTEILRDNDASCKTMQSAKRPKVNNNLLHVPTIVNCDSNSSSVNSSSVHCTSDRLNIETKELDHDSNCKELNKSSVISNTDENTSEQKPEHNEAILTVEQSNKFSDDKNPDERKLLNEENKRVLRARDKQKRVENKQTAFRSREHTDNVKIKEGFEVVQKTQISDVQNDTNEMVLGSVDDAESPQKTEDVNDLLNNELDAGELEPQARSRRGRELKKRKEELSNSSKTKRVKRDLRKSDQQNKEETLLDNEVAKINENNRSFLNKYGSASGERTDSFRGFFEQDGQSGLVDKVDKDPNLRSKSENDIETIIGAKIGKNEERQLSRNLSENHVSQQTADNIDILENERKTLKTPELVHKDSDETSTSGESFNSGTPKILETPEDKERKESILRLLGLESLEEAAKRQNQQKKKEQSSTGTLKTIIRVSQKEKDKDKRGSRSPLKMVLKQQGRGDGEGDSPEFYTIQKEFGTSGLGDSSSGANRKFTTNHRHSCDDDNEDAAPKDRQSLVIPEKSSSFSIHPGRVCADVCCYCFGKFGSLDTPMHLAQIKSDERRKKILNIERHLTKDSCLCDACYRHVDRKANTSPANMQQKPQKQHRQLMMSKCSARECRDPARHHVKRRWLLKIRTGLQNQVDIDWDSNQITTMSFCVNHYEKIGRFLTCALCKRRLARQHTHQLSIAEIDELNHKLSQQGIPILLAAGTFVCKLCRYFAQLQLKYREIENMNTNHRVFCKSYRKRILHNLGIDVEDEVDDDSSQQMNQVNQTKDKKSKKSIKNLQTKSGSSKSPERTTSGTSDKSTPEPNKNESTVECSSEMGNENRARKSSNDESGGMDVHYLENTVENLKKRKTLDLRTCTASTSISSLCDGMMANGMTLGMDEVTLTRLPKRPRLNNNSNNNNDIAPVVQRLGANPSISVRTLFPGEEEMNLHVNIEFQNVREVTPQGWEKCATMIQYDRETKHLWQQLQRPYGNQSSFLRHLILLEKYYRAGDLILAPNASRNAINYSTSVQNRLISYEGPEKMDEPIMEPIATEYSNSRRLSGGYVLEKDRLSVPGTSLMSRPLTSGATSHSVKMNSPRMLKLSSGVSIIKKSPPNLQRLSIPSTSTNGGGSVKRKDGQSLSSIYGSGGKIFQLCESDMKRMQTFKRQKFNDKPATSTNNGSSTSGSFRSQYQKTQITIPGHSQQFQKHLRMQQEMLNRQSRGDFEPLICDMTRSVICTNENSPTTSQNILHNLNLPKSIQVTTKPTSTNNQIPILPKIPKSLTVIPQTVTRSVEK